MAKFTPPVSREFLSPPGDSIKKILSERKWTQKELSNRIDVTEKHLSKLIKAEVPLTPDMAEKLSLALGNSPRFWINREAGYRERLKSVEEKELLESECIKWAEALPLKNLQKCNILPEGRVSSKFISENIKAILSFFGVSSHLAWRRTYGQQAIMYRKSSSHSIDENAVISWLRVGEIYAENNTCRNVFDKKKLEKNIGTIRGLTTEPPSLFEPKLKEILEDCGVLLCIVDAFKNTRTSGAVRMKSGMPLIQMSIYGKKNDLFWFTLFHELAHILLHLDKESIFLEDSNTGGAVDILEQEANDWARSTLIPDDYIAELPLLQSKASIKAFAKKINIHPGIVVGRLHHDGILPFTHCHDLKDTFILN